MSTNMNVRSFEVILEHTNYQNDWLLPSVFSALICVNSDLLFYQSTFPHPHFYKYDYLT